MRGTEARGRSSLLIAVAVLLAAPAFALAGFPGSYQNDYEAVIERDQNARFGFDVVRESGEKFANEFDVANIPVGCTDAFGSAKRIDVVVPEQVLVDVKQKLFAGTIITGADPEAKLKVAGELLGNGRAKGTVRVRTQGSNDEDDCYSGLMSWKDTGDN